VGIRNDAPGCGLTMMKVNENTPVKTLFPIVAMVLIGTTYATSAKSRYYIIPDRSRCPHAMSKGAQRALDAYINSIISKKYFYEKMYEEKERGKIMDEDIESGNKKREGSSLSYNEFESKMEPTSSYIDIDLRMLADKKLVELKMNALTNYKCDLKIFNTAPDYR
jgi:hypothetical protein